MVHSIDSTLYHHLVFGCLHLGIRELEESVCYGVLHCQSKQEVFEIQLRTRWVCAHVRAH